MNDLTLYNTYRPKIDTGDLIEFAADDELGRLIRWKTGEDVNHSALVIVMDSPYTKTERRYLHEAMADGVETDYLSVVLSKYNGHAWWYPMKPDLNSLKGEIEDLAFQYVGVDYNYEGLVRQLFGHSVINYERMFCSEFVFVAHKGNGVAPWPGELPKVMPHWDERIQIL